MKSSETSDVDQRLLIIGKQVRKLRKTKSTLNYIEFAKKIGMNRKTYYKVERGKEEYYLTTLLKIISAYPKVTMESFFKDIEL